MQKMTEHLDIPHTLILKTRVSHCFAPLIFATLTASKLKELADKNLVSIHDNSSVFHLQHILYCVLSCCFLNKQTWNWGFRFQFLGMSKDGQMFSFQGYNYISGSFAFKKGKWKTKYLIFFRIIKNRINKTEKIFKQDRNWRYNDNS